MRRRIWVPFFCEYAPGEYPGSMRVRHLIGAQTFISRAGRLRQTTHPPGREETPQLITPTRAPACPPLRASRRASARLGEPAPTFARACGQVRQCARVSHGSLRHVLGVTLSVLVVRWEGHLPARYMHGRSVARTARNVLFAHASPWRPSTAPLHLPRTRAKASMGSATPSTTKQAHTLRHVRTYLRKSDARGLHAHAGRAILSLSARQRQRRRTDGDRRSQTVGLEGARTDSA